MGTLRPLRFVVAWQAYRVGDVITPPAGLAAWLVANGYCERAALPAAPAPVTAPAPAAEAGPRKKAKR